MLDQTRRTPAGMTERGSDKSSVGAAGGASQDTATVNLRISVQGWADEIRPHLLDAVENIVAAGNKLIEAKATLPHGAFGPLLAELGISAEMARRFMRVAQHPAIANRSRVTDLPAAIGTLDVLVRLDDDDLNRAITAGEITSSTTRGEAEEIVRRRRETDRLAEEMAAAVRRVDESVAASPVPIQQRDHVVNASSISYMLLTIKSREVGHDDAAAGTRAWMVETFPDLMVLLNFTLAALWLGDVNIDNRLRIDQPFAPQVCERMGAGEDLVDAARSWLDGDSGLTS